MKTQSRMSGTAEIAVEWDRLRRPTVISGFLVLLLLALFAFAEDKPAEVKGGNGVVLPPPPSTETKPSTETIHGTTLVDPYRWLEDANSPATRSWIDEQMKYTEQYLSQVKIRPEIVNELTRLERVESYSIPIERGGSYFFTKRLAGRKPGIDLHAARTARSGHSSGRCDETERGPEHVGPDQRHFERRQTAGLRHPFWRRR